ARSSTPAQCAGGGGRRLHGSTLPALGEILAETQHRAPTFLPPLPLPHLPTRSEVLNRATAMFARTPSIDDIVDQAHALLLDAIGARLCPVVAYGSGGARGRSLRAAPAKLARDPGRGGACAGGASSGRTDGPASH